MQEMCLGYYQRTFSELWKFSNFERGTIVILVNIQRRTSHSTFDGFIVQALDKMTGRYIGRFLDADGLYLLDECSAVMNKDNKPKTFVNLAWVAPFNQRGDVFFRGTVIERRNKYFENLLSRLEPSRTTRLFKMRLQAFKT